MSKNNSTTPTLTTPLTTTTPPPSGAAPQLSMASAVDDAMSEEDGGGVGPDDRGGAVADADAASGGGSGVGSYDSRSRGGGGSRADDYGEGDGGEGSDYHTSDDDDDDDDDDEGSYDSREDDSRERSLDIVNSANDYVRSFDRTNSNDNKKGGGNNAPGVGSMSERANAILQTINERRNSTPGDGGSDHHLTRSESVISEGDDYSQDSYISGASSASEISSRIEGASHGYSQQQPPRQSPAQSRFEEAKTSPAKRKDSLTRAQAVLTDSSVERFPTARQSFSHRNDNTAAMTKGKLYSEIEEERRRRLELEKRLAESNQREEEFTHENRRLEKSWNDVKSQLDTVQAEVRSSKYSLSEQASRIKELERKLKNEKEKYEELERERDTMKDEYDQDLEEQKDINRQLEQMVMSEEFEKELEDEINQVKELEHANRRFKVKIESKWRYPSLLSPRFLLPRAIQVWFLNLLLLLFPSKSARTREGDHFQKVRY
jgi:hypothetical protein